MIMSQTRLILASGSPRRKALLSATGFRFDVIESGIEEKRGADESGQNYALRTAAEKALAVSARVRHALILAADTIVICNDEILTKPRDEDEAREMLATLSDKTHTVITAYALATAGIILEAKPIISLVTFRALSDSEVEAYVASGEPMDKAGAYGIQGTGSDFITHVVGSRDNVMGLPLNEVLVSLARFDVLPERSKDGCGC